ncbi:sensor histidine kinase [Streptacidiphilus cavernicola]|uniref:Sensor histidine kinase n=1 Tax=Streptacidiphilus cavernicola TaxID=3342716 RepID=A0ABV6VRJ5_9ACTN
MFAILCYSAIAVTNVATSGARNGTLIVFTGCIAAVFVIQVVNSSPRIRSWSTRKRLLALGGQAVLTYGPAVVFGVAWGGMLGFLAGSVLLLLSGRTAWVMFGAVVASSLVFAVAYLHSPVDIAYVVQSTSLTGLVIYGLTRLSDLVEEVNASRITLARAAVGQERLRFARDLHDLLGYSLSAITLKTELIHRLVGVRPDRACEEIVGVLDISRQALADVRLVASGYRDMSLVAEAESAARTLQAADVQAEVDISCGRLHPVVDTVLATALREGITNVLRHSRVQHCSISASLNGGLVRMSLVNDGVEDQRGQSPPHSGSGLGNLQTRLTAIGGMVSAGVRGDGRFHLDVEAPVRQAGPAAAGSVAGSAPGPSTGAVSEPRAAVG